MMGNIAPPYMLLSFLLFVPVVGIFLISSGWCFAVYKDSASFASSRAVSASLSGVSKINFPGGGAESPRDFYKITAFCTSLINLIISLVIFILFDFSYDQSQFIQEHYQILFNSYDIYLGVDGISMYFILLTTIIFPIALMSN